MHDHYSFECQHDLKYCPHCDVVYCSKCKREWGTTFYYPYRYYPPYTITWASSGQSSGMPYSGTGEYTVNPACNHI